MRHGWFDIVVELFAKLPSHYLEPPVCSNDKAVVAKGIFLTIDNQKRQGLRFEWYSPAGGPSLCCGHCVLALRVAVRTNNLAPPPKAAVYHAAGSQSWFVALDSLTLLLSSDEDTELNIAFYFDSFGEGQPPSGEPLATAGPFTIVAGASDGEPCRCAASHDHGMPCRELVLMSCAAKRFCRVTLDLDETKWITPASYAYTVAPTTPAYFYVVPYAGAKRIKWWCGTLDSSLSAPVISTAGLTGEFSGAFVMGDTVGGQFPWWTTGLYPALALQGTFVGRP